MATSVLLDRAYRRLVTLCFDSPRSIKQLAEQTGDSMNSTFYRVRRLVRDGLLRLHHEEGRAGKAIKYYVPTQSSYDIPFTETLYASYVEFLFDALQGNLKQFLERSYTRLNVPDADFMFHLEYKDGQLQTDIHIQGLSPEARDELYVQHHLMHRWVLYRLPQAKADHFFQELELLLLKFLEHPSKASDDDYRVGVFFLPQ